MKSQNSLFLRITLFSMISIWIILIFFEIIAKAVNNLYVLIPFLKGMFSLVCHQDSSKSLAICDVHSLVCIRCTGLYFGAWLAAFLSLFYEKLFKYLKRSYFMALLGFMFLDVFFVNIGLYDYNSFISILSGIFLGFVCFLYLYKGLFEFYYNKEKE